MIYYTADEHSRIKIGFTSRDAQARADEGDTFTADKLTVITTTEGDQETERQIQAEFEEFRITRNKEWFTYEPGSDLYLYVNLIRCCEKRCNCNALKIRDGGFDVFTEAACIEAIRRGRIAATRIAKELNPLCEYAQDAFDVLGLKINECWSRRCSETVEANATAMIRGICRTRRLWQRIGYSEQNTPSPRTLNGPLFGELG